MTALNALRWLYGVQSTLCLFFYYSTGGLGYLEANGETYTPVKNLLSSGSDDIIAIFLPGVVAFVIV